MLTSATQRCRCGKGCMPGSRPDQAGMTEVWFMVKLQDLSLLLLLLLLFWTSQPSCMHPLLSDSLNSTSFIHPFLLWCQLCGTQVSACLPACNPARLKLCCCLVNSGPFLALTTCRILYAVLQLSITAVSDEAETQVCYPIKPAVSLASSGPWSKEVAAALTQLPLSTQDPR